MLVAGYGSCCFSSSSFFRVHCSDGIKGQPKVENHSFRGVRFPHSPGELGRLRLGPPTFRRARTRSPARTGRAAGRPETRHGEGWRKWRPLGPQDGWKNGPIFFWKAPRVWVRKLCKCVPPTCLPKAMLNQHTKNNLHNSDPPSNVRPKSTHQSRTT